CPSDLNNLRRRLAVVCLAAMSPWPLLPQRPVLPATTELVLSGKQLDLVAIANLIIGKDGRLHVWQDADGMIRRFDSAGGELGSVAPNGEGPGEFRLRSLGGVVGDTLWVSDPMLRRTTMFRADGSLLRTTRWASTVESAGESFG